jgi:putative membrane protein
LKRWAPAALGPVVLAAVLSPPFDRAADTSLAAHMWQHVLLLSVAAPALVLSFEWAWPTSGSWSRRPLRSQAWVAAAAAAVVVQSVVTIAWHLPGPYQSAAAHLPVHMAEHLSFLGAGIALWWLLLGAGTRRPRAASLLVLFAANVPLQVLGFAMTMATTRWYPAYATSLADQQLAGAVMWGVGGSIAVLQAMALFAAWVAGAAEGETDGDDVRPSRDGRRAPHANARG